MNLLAITHTYRSFQKESIESTASFFQNVFTLVRVNPLVELSKFLPVGNFSQNRIEYKIDMTDTPPNCHVFRTPITYLPIDYQYRTLGERHYKSVKKTIAENNLSFDIIHSHFTWSAGYAGARLKEETGVPFIVTAHGQDIYSLPFKNEFWREKIRFVLNTADFIITVSQSNKACIEKLDITTPVKVIPNGFPSDLFFPRDQQQCRLDLKLPLDKKIILTAGNFVPIKGQEYLIAAMSEISKKRNDVLCIIIGNGPLEQELKREVARRNLQSTVIFPGRKSHAEIAIWMNACDLFVLPSLNEGNPTVMFECIACGKPFVGTRVGGIPEIINSHDYGIVVEPQNSMALFNSIQNALEKKWDSDTIISYSRNFSWNSISKEIIKIYKSV
jgi:glycosyltransferase involved in cell wall biosynthesis